MSYCRVGERGSQVYAYRNVDGFYYVHAGERSYRCEDLGQLRGVLARLREEGLAVPDAAFERIARELAGETFDHGENILVDALMANLDGMRVKVVALGAALRAARDHIDFAGGATPELKERITQALSLIPEERFQLIDPPIEEVMACEICGTGTPSMRLEFNGITAWTRCGMCGSVSAGPAVMRINVILRTGSAVGPTTVVRREYIELPVSAVTFDEIAEGLVVRAGREEAHDFTGLVLDGIAIVKRK